MTTWVSPFQTTLMILNRVLKQLLTQDMDGNFLFRVFNRFGLRLKDRSSVIRLEFEGGPSPEDNRSDGFFQPRWTNYLPWPDTQPPVTAADSILRRIWHIRRSPAMEIKNDGIRLWYGTHDAPAPVDAVSVDTKLTVTIGVEPVDASNAVAVRYRVNQGSTVTLAASHLPLVGDGRAQYFRATLPAFQVGDRVEYTPICRCAGRQVPSPEETKQFAGSFRVVASQQMPNTTPTDQPGRQPPNNPSSSSSSDSGDSAAMSKGVASMESKTQPTASNSKEHPRKPPQPLLITKPASIRSMLS
jgi:hypothetical protein